MVYDVAGENLLEDVVAAVLHDVAGLVLPGSNLAGVLAKHACKALFYALSSNEPAVQRAKMDEFVRVPFVRSYEIAAAKVAEVDLPEDQKLTLVRYLSAIPMSSRQALQRWDDGGHVTTLLSQLPRSLDEMARFVPIRPPRFDPGYKVPLYDLELDLLLGQGGFAEVWKAHNTEFEGQPPVALKFCLDKELVPSLRREMELLAKLRGHEPGKDFVQLMQTAYGADPPFLMYEYIDGGNLAGWLESFEGKAPAQDNVISVIKMTARAVAVAHDRGIVHRDLKPSNLLITRSGRVKVADFGIGSVTSDFEAGRSGVQNAAAGDPGIGHGAHTPMYTDPARDPSAPPDPRDDVYAMGVLAYQLLLGNVSSQMRGGWRRHLANRGVPDRLIEIIETCVAPPEERFTNAGALLAALERPLTAGSSKLRASSKGAKAQVMGAKSETTAVIKFCHRCGARALRSNRFCNSCGYQYPDSVA